MNIIPLTKESKTYSGWSTQRKNLQLCKNHLNKENLNEFKGGILLKKCFIGAKETHPDIGAHAIRSGQFFFAYITWAKESTREL